MLTIPSPCSECQRRDWSCHKVRCRGGRPTPVGLPFVVSLPQSKLTYSRLASVAEKFARSAISLRQVVSYAKSLFSMNLIIPNRLIHLILIPLSTPVLMHYAYMYNVVP